MSDSWTNRLEFAQTDNERINAVKAGILEALVAQEGKCRTFAVALAEIRREGSMTAESETDKVCRQIAYNEAFVEMLNRECIDRPSRHLG